MTVSGVFHYDANEFHFQRRAKFRGDSNVCTTCAQCLKEIGGGDEGTSERARAARSEHVREREASQVL